MAQTCSLGTIPGFTSCKLKATDKIYLQIKAQYFDTPAIICKRRFFYLWKRPSGTEKWQSVGLCMTDDHGILFELEPFLKSINFPKNDITIFKYDPSQGKFIDKPWSLYGDAEDILALQKHLSEPFVGKEAKSSDATEKKFGSSSLFLRPIETREYLYRNPFLINDNYKFRFIKGQQYFLMFFPPHIAGRSTGNKDRSIVSIDQPPELLTDNSYIVEPEDTVRKICTKFELSPSFDLVGYKNNKKALNPYGQNFKPGSVIAIPPQARGPLGFGRIIELRGVAQSVNLSSEWFNLIEPYSAELDKTPVVSLELPVTLEEHTARMAENLALLDMTWSVLIEAARPFAEAANQVRAIAELVDIMRRYPGYKNRRIITNTETGPYYSSVEYSDKESFTKQEARLNNDAFNRAKIFENDLMLAAFNEQNPIFNHERESFYALIEDFEHHMKSRSLQLALGQWITHVTIGTSETYPYTFPADKAPLFFEILKRSFQTLLSIRAPYPIQHSPQELRTVGDAVYENIMSRFELQLQVFFHIGDRSGTIHKEFLEQMKAQGFLSKSTESIFDEEVYMPERLEDGGTLLGFIFSEILLHKRIAGIEDCVESILNAGTEYRTKMLKLEARRRSITASFAYFKVVAGLKFRSGLTPVEIIKEAKESLNFLANERRHYAAIAKNINKSSKEKFKSVSAPPELSLISKAIAAGITIYSISDFANKLQSARSNNLNLSFDEWVGFAASLHSFGMAAAGFTTTMLKTTDAILSAQEFLQESIDSLTSSSSICSKVAGFADSANKKLGSVGIIFSIYETYKAYETSMSASRSGDTLQASMRWVQFGLNIASTVTSVIPGGVLVSIALEGTNIAISGYIQLSESLKSGVESMIRKINSELSNNTLLRSKHFELMTDKKYYLASDHDFVHVKLSAEQYKIGKKILDGLNVLQDRLKLRYVNIDPIAGGAVLLKLGYSIRDVGLIVSKQEKLNRNEVNFIEGFSQTGVFDLRDCKMQIASGKYRFPDDDYLQDNNGAKMLHYDPEQYFKRYYPEHRVSLTRY